MENSGKPPAYHFAALAGICAFILLFDSAASSVISRLLPAGGSGHGGQITARHFAGPGFIFPDGATVAKFAEYWGAWAFYLFLALAAIGGALLVVFVRACAASGAETDAEAEGPEKATAPRRGKGALLVAGTAGLALAAASLCFSAGVNKSSASPSPLVRPAFFYHRFNSALLSKLLFDEESYQKKMFSALESDRKLYLWFARSGYWSFYGNSKNIKWADRREYAARDLYGKWKGRTLDDCMVGPAAALCKEVGMAEEASQLAEYLAAVPAGVCGADRAEDRPAP